MLFSELNFAYWYLPQLLLVYYLAPHSLRNALLAAASLFFYGWGEYRLMGVMLFSIAMNYGLGIWIHDAANPSAKRRALATGIVLNLSLLAFFKYAAFVVANVNGIITLAGASPVGVPHIPLPLGISFFTFHAMSYLIDVYRGETEVQRNLMQLTLYICLFPQLIAGPIIRYHDIADQLMYRTMTWERFAGGVSRFLLGLGKKMILANAVSWPADQIYAIPSQELTCSLAWLGTTCYLLQIYLDFSAYSDMAIGLGQMFGFDFLENFDYPYIARSITEFWRRWHISLSRWYRDYLYIPLGGNRYGEWITYRNLAIVFLLCGLWHGASWTFVAWGLFHGLFLILERMGLASWMARRPVWCQHLYVLIVVMIGWVFFRAETFTQGVAVLKAMVGVGTGNPRLHPVGLYWNWEVAVGIIGGIVASMPALPWLSRQMERWEARGRVTHAVGSLVRVQLLLALLFYSSLLMAGSTYNPFIYFRF